MSKLVLLLLLTLLLLLMLLLLLLLLPGGPVDPWTCGPAKKRCGVLFAPKEPQQHSWAGPQVHGSTGPPGNNNSSSSMSSSSSTVGPPNFSSIVPRTEESFFNRLVLAVLRTLPAPAV